jgi:hypothetical protein
VLHGLRAAYLAAAVLLLLVLPLGDSSVFLALFVAVDLAAACLMFPGPEPQPAPPLARIGGSEADPSLIRRTIPGLRGRRPEVVIDEQVRWRQAAEFRQRRKALAQRYPHLIGE